MKKPKHWHCDTWGENFWFFVGWPFEEFESYVEEHFNYLVRDGSIIRNGMYLRLRKGCASVGLIWTAKKHMPTLAHECVHAAGACLESKGVIADWKNDEPLTYLVEALMRKAV